MANNNEEGLTTDILTKVGEWNIADKFNKDQVLALLVECDRLRRVAIFGYDKIEEMGSMPMAVGTSARIEALGRMMDMLRNLIENSTFAVDGTHRKSLIELQERIKYVASIFPYSYYEYNDIVNKRHVIEIVEPVFIAIVNNLREVKQEILGQIWTLIYPKSKEMDPKAMMEAIIRRGG